MCLKLLKLSISFRKNIFQLYRVERFL